jgi:hypothetical protein
MSLKQMAILTATVVALVVIVTLMKVGLGRTTGRPSGPEKSAPLSAPHLTFARVYGPFSRFATKDVPLPPDEEVGTDGSYDFWFDNKNDAPVEVFVTEVSCGRCVNVKMGLAPEDVRLTDPEKPPQPGPDVGWTNLEPEAGKRDAHGFTVPPKASGWLRLGWKVEEVSGKVLFAIIRTTSPAGSAPTVKLECAGNFVDPVRVLPEPKELAVDTMSAGDDQPRTASFTVYSSTRKHFDLTPERSEDPFVTFGELEALTEKECADLAQQTRREVLCGYKVPVAVRERLADGKEVREHDLGPFRTTVALKTDVMSEKVGLTVTGLVKGKVTVLSEGVKDRIALGSYPQSSGTTKTVTVEAPAGVNVTLDSWPDFMTAELLPESQPEGPPRKTRTWNLKVTVKPGVTFPGQFGAAGESDKSNVVIFLKANERRVRIPVGGTVLPK